MSEEKRVVELDQYEHRAIVNIINDKRTEMIQEQKDDEFITEILQKVIDAPTKKKSLFKKDKDRDER